MQKERREGWQGDSWGGLCLGVDAWGSGAESGTLGVLRNGAENTSAPRPAAHAYSETCRRKRY